MSEAVLFNSLTFYILHDKMVEGGRFIDTAVFPKLGYIRSKPEVVIAQIQSFSTNIINDSLRGNWHTIDDTGDLTNQPVTLTPGFSITWHQEDAKRIAELARKNVHGHLLFILIMLGNQPLGLTYATESGLYPDSRPNPDVQLPAEPQTMYFLFRDHQNIKKINAALEKLVRPE